MTELSARSRRGVVVAPHVLAAEAGAEILKEGGNAIEAAVAAAAAIVPAYPHMNHIGGDGFWIVREPSGKVRYIEAAGFAGARSTIDFYKAQWLSAIPERGANAAVTVPGAIGGWQLVLEVSKTLGGKVPVSRLLEAATAIAKKGCPVTRLMEELLADRVADLDAPGFRDTYWPGGKRPKAGDTLKPDKLGATFERLHGRAARAFARRH